MKILSIVTVLISSAVLGPVGFVLSVFLISILYFGAKKAEKDRIEEEQKAKALQEKYGEEIAEKITNKEVWIGATEEQIILSKGNPVSQDVKILKSKNKKTLKYDQIGKNKYALKVYFEDDVCTGWNQKQTTDIENNQIKNSSPKNSSPKRSRGRKMTSAGISIGKRGIKPYFRIRKPRIKFW